VYRLNKRSMARSCSPLCRVGVCSNCFFARLLLSRQTHLRGEPNDLDFLRENRKHYTRRQKQRGLAIRGYI
jgi:hypothetical protein